MTFLSRFTLFFVTAALVVITGFSPSAAQACMRIPPAPFCGKTLVLTKAAPPSIFVPAGIAPSFSIPFEVFWNMTNVGVPALCPAPTGPGGTFPATLSMEISCVGGPGLAAPVTLPIDLDIGFNPGTVPVTLPAGPPRSCTVAGTVTLPLADGMTLRARGDSVVCLVEPSPDDPSKPRLDLEFLSSEIQHSHPGDQGEFRFKVTNNDPAEEVLITVDAEMEQVSRLPEIVVPGGAPGTNVFSLADPLQGDNFPIAFDPDLPASQCVYLPPDPGDPALKRAQETFIIPPGASVEFPVYSRSWGLCPNGSCAEGRVMVDGTFDGGDTALACGGISHVVDTAVPPSYAWPGSGKVVTLAPIDPVALAMLGEPQQGLPLQIDLVQFPQPLFIGNQQVFPQQPQMQLIQDIRDEQARQTHVFQLPQPASPGSQGGFGLQTQFFTPIQADSLTIGQIHPGAPNGFETLAPGAKIEVVYNIAGQPQPLIFDVMTQVSGQALVAPVPPFAIPTGRESGGDKRSSS